MSRYAGKPFLRLLECYVLAVIGRLDEAQQNTLRLMEPKLQETYGAKGSWMEIVDVQMDFPNSLHGKIREIWQKNLSQAESLGVDIDANKFAVQFVDENFVS